MAQRRGLVEEADRGKARGDTLFFLGPERVESDESSGFVELHEKAEPGLERGVDFIEIVPVEGITFLKPQGVSRAEAARDGSGSDESIPPVTDLLDRSEEFKSLFAGVAGAAESDMTKFADAIVDDATSSGLDRMPEGDGLGSLHGKGSEFSAAVAEGHPFPGMGEHPCAVLVDAGGVDDEKKPFLARTVDDEVIDDAALFVEKEGVVPFPDGEGGDVVGEESVEPVHRSGALDLEFAHVRDVEDPYRISHRLMLGDDALVLDGHFPAGEGHDAGAEGEVAVVKGRAMHAGSVAKENVKSTQASVIAGKVTRIAADSV